MAVINPVRIELPTPFDVGPVNAYLFPAPEPVLVDTGVDTEESWQVLVEALAAHGLAVADLQRVIITHAHVDHFGAAARLAAHSQAQIHIAGLGADWLLHPRQKWGQRIAYYRDYFLAACGLSPAGQQLVVAYMTAAAENSPPVAPERVTTFAIGAQLPLGGAGWQVLHMPGHAYHQTCFYQPETEQLISADMLLHKTPTPIVEAPPDGRTRVPALPVYLDSLARVEALALAQVYPGHGRVITNPYALIQQQRQRILERKEEAYSLIQEGHATLMALVNIMYAHYPENARIAGLWMLVGYVDLLQAEQRLQAWLVDGVWHYEPAA